MSVPVYTRVARYFGSQVRKERESVGWTIAHLARITGIDSSHLSRIERGERNPTPDIAKRLDERAFPKRGGHFMELFLESQTWVPPAFRKWSEYEDKATRLFVWSPYTVHGLLQTRNYAQVILSLASGVAQDQVTARLNERMNRQRRILHRADPPVVWFVVDELSLFRRVGTPEDMAEQCAHLLGVAALPHVTLTVMPAIAHNANEGGFIVADSAVYAESAASKGVHTDQTVSELLAKFGMLQAESYRAAESVAVIERVGAIWASGVSPLTRAVMGGTA